MTFEEVLAEMSTDELKKDIADLQAIIFMKNSGATSSDIENKYGTLPDNPESDLVALQAELAKREGSATKKFSTKKVVIILLILVAGYYMWKQTAKE
jgi:hypothetical protein